MKTLQSDLIALAIEGRFDVIVHGCNCFNTMGAGIAKSIKEAFPAAYRADQRTVAGDKSKLGTYSFARIDRSDGSSFTIVNAYTQYRYGKPGPHVDYDAIERVFTALAQDFDGQRFGYPLIGAGLAGGDWNVIAPIIDAGLSGQDHTLVRYAPQASLQSNTTNRPRSGFRQ